MIRRENPGHLRSRENGPSGKPRPFVILTILHTKNLLLGSWGDDNYFTTRSLHVFITKLRRKLSADPSVRILNVRGTGYKLIEE